MLCPFVAAKVSIAHGWNATFVAFGAVHLLGALAWLQVDASRPIWRPMTGTSVGGSSHPEPDGGS